MTPAVRQAADELRRLRRWVDEAENGPAYEWCARGYKLEEAARNHLPAILDALEEAEARVEAAERRRDFCEQWYAERLEPIKDVSKRVGVWPEVAAIIANGSCSPHTPPTYAQQLNIAKYKAEAANARADALAAQVAELEEAIRWALGEVDEFRSREQGEGAFWWRKELRQRAALLSDTKGGGDA